MSTVSERLQRRTERQIPAKQVRLRLVYIDFWSAVKLSFIVWLCLGVVLIVAADFAWIVLASTHIFAQLDSLFQQILNDDKWTIESQFSIGTLTVFAIVIALLNTVLGTILGAIGSVLYNLTVRITGGLLVGFQNN